jgi:hypothetical protein
VLPAHVTSPAIKRQRFEREAQAVAALSHRRQQLDGGTDKLAIPWSFLKTSADNFFILSRMRRSMRVTIPGGIALTLVPIVIACDGPTQPGSGPQPRDLQVFVDQKPEFDNAARDLGARTIIDFEDVDTAPVTGTISGRPSFDRSRYASLGFVFSNPNNVPLYVAPRGLFWNPTNSLSVGRFPNDPLDNQLEAPFVEDDDLTVTFEPGCVAAAFSVIDKANYSEDFVEFVDSEGRLLRRVSFPREFLGMVAPVRPDLVQARLGTIRITEGGNDGDDVTYDGFVCVRSR